jgi:DNA-binding winged helix-turn-helix (wHTH) protein
MFSSTASMRSAAGRRTDVVPEGMAIDATLSLETHYLLRASQVSKEAPGFPQDFRAAVRTRFGPFTLDTETRQLLEGPREIHLSPKAFDVLRLLLDGRPGVVDKAAIHARIWPGTFVVDANLSVLIGEIRRAVNDTPSDERFIRTVHRVGYAFCGDAVELSPGPVTTAETAGPDLAAALAPTGLVRCWLVWEERRIALGEGDHVVGRDPNCAVWLDASGISRRHACLRIGGAGHDVSIEDLGSTNGTIVHGSAIAARTTLSDGDLIQIGAAELTFRAWSDGKTPATERIQRDRRSEGAGER